MNKFLKIITTALLALFLSLNFSTISVADNHDKSAEAEIIKELKKEIYSFDAEPPKKKLFQSKKKYIPILKEQLAELKKEEEKNKKVEALKKEIIKEIESLGENPVTENKEVNKDQEIIALKKQLEDIKSSKAAEKKKNDDKKAAEKKKTDDKKAADKKIADKKAADKKAADENEQSRTEVIQSIKNEILFLGETPLLEFEATNEDEYFDALRKQIDEIKAIKAEEEKDIQQSIPSWFIKLPQGSDTMMYIRGTAVVDTLQGSIDMATNAALRELGKKLDSRLNSKVKETVRQAGIGEDLVTKTEINRVSAYVVKEVTISGWEILETKLVTLDNGKYRSFILVKYPVAQAYQAYISEIENNPKLKNKLSAIKDTEAFKELESFVSEFTGA